MNTNIWPTISRNVVGNESQWFWAMVQAVGVIVTLWFIWRQIKLQRVGNMLASLEALNERWGTSDMVKARQNVCKAYLENKESGIQSAEQIAGFFEELGIYEETGVFDLKTVWELYGEYVEYYWPIMWPKIKEARKGDHSGYTCFEKLWKRCDSWSRKAGTVSGPKTPEELKDFAESEMQKK